MPATTTDGSVPGGPLGPPQSNSIQQQQQQAQQSLVTDISSQSLTTPAPQTVTLSITLPPVATLPSSAVAATAHHTPHSTHRSHSHAQAPPPPLPPGGVTTLSHAIPIHSHIHSIFGSL